MDSDRVPR